MTARPTLAPPAIDRAGPLDRALRLFADVRAGEGSTALLLALNVFLLLATYYCIRPVREALILSTEGGAELKSYLAAGQAVLLLGLGLGLALLAGTAVGGAAGGVRGWVLRRLRPGSMGD